MENTYVCTNCGAEYISWQGFCNSCNEWNTIEQQKQKIINKKILIDKTNQKYDLKSIKLEKTKKITFNFKKFNEILNGGILPGQVILISGQPGIGKSTLLAHLSKNSSHKILYVSGEENLEQIKIRFLRIGKEEDFKNTVFQSTNSLDLIIENLTSKNYEVIIIDSIQTIHSNNIDSNTGSISQIRECAQMITNYAKAYNVAVIMISQINKEGLIAGPKVLEHIVDTIIMFEEDKNSNIKTLRVEKNRFGNTKNIAIYKMKKKGLKEIKNMEQMFIKSIEHEVGISYSIYNEGNIYFIAEVQALCIKTYFNYPKRVSNGYEIKRLEMLIAIMSNLLNLELEKYDIYVNLTGGIQAYDTGIDLAVIAAIISSLKKIKIQEKSCFLGELTLTGKIKPSTKHNERKSKAKKLGFKNIYDFKNLKHIQEIYKVFNGNKN